MISLSSYRLLKVFRVNLDTIVDVSARWARGALHLARDIHFRLPQCVARTMELKTKTFRIINQLSFAG